MVDHQQFVFYSHRTKTCEQRGWLADWLAATQCSLPIPQTAGTSHLALPRRLYLMFRQSDTREPSALIRVTGSSPHSVFQLLGPLTPAHLPEFGRGRSRLEVNPYQTGILKSFQAKLAGAMSGRLCANLVIETRKNKDFRID
jgi:hypothetical protein